MFAHLIFHEVMILHIFNILKFVSEINMSQTFLNIQYPFFYTYFFYFDLRKCETDYLITSP